MSDPGEPLRPPAAKLIFGKYELGRLLGIGASGKVYHARDVAAGNIVAVKVIDKHRLTASSGGERVVREVTAMRRLRHPNVVRLDEVLATKTKIYLVLEHLKGGDLFSRIEAAGRLSEPVARQYFRQLVSAIRFCHQRGVFHRDLKPENLLLDEHDRLKVSDFGLSAAAAGGDPLLLRTRCGTPAYAAPEILVRKEYSGAAADVWACGVVLYVMVAGYLPFNHVNLMSLYRKICRGEFRFPRWASPELRRLVSRLLDTNPETRIAIDEVARDPWVLLDGGGDSDDAATAAIPFGLEPAAAEGRCINAFDIISFASGLDLSGMFVPVDAHRERFVAAGTVNSLICRAERLGEAAGLVAKRSLPVKGGWKKGADGEDGDLHSMAVVLIERIENIPVATVAVRRLTESLVVVEVEKRAAAVPGQVPGRCDGWIWEEKFMAAAGGG